MPLPESLAALSREAKTPKHCTKARVKENNRPLLQLVSQARQQFAEYRMLLNDVEQDETLPDDLRGKFEFLHQGLRAAERIAGEYQEAGRRLTTVTVQLEADFAAAFADIARVLGDAPGATSDEKANP